jgi:hypothetical protein
VPAIVWATEGAASQGLIIRLIIQTILLDPSGVVWTDEAPNVSSPDPSGADQIDAEHQATDLGEHGRGGRWSAGSYVDDDPAARAVCFLEHDQCGCAVLWNLVAEGRAAGLLGR